MKTPLVSYYGDDFTGSVDVMETLTLQGLNAALFLDAPSQDVLESRFPDLDAVGVAGVSRSLDVAALREELRPKFRALKALGSPIVHYKTCSTFDSSPTVGNIGKAVELGMEILGATCAPLILGTPYLKRFVAFGNLFATIGDTTYRIDRHPMMSKHPITPMDEGDVRLHMAKQTDIPVHLIDTLHLRQPYERLAERFVGYRDSGQRGMVLIDTVTDEELPLVGKLLWENKGDKQMLVVGSSGIEFCLAAYWQRKGEFQALAEKPSAAEVDQMLVMCGSASPATKLQIETAENAGYVSLAIDGPGLMDPQKSDTVAAALVESALALLGQGKNVILYATKGPDDPIIAQTKAAAARLGVPNASQLLAKTQGSMLKTLLERSGLRRAVVAGGDTSGYVCQELGIFALQVASILAPGSPICRAISNTPDFDGIELCLKAGQAGEPDYFERVRRGRP